MEPPRRARNAAAPRRHAGQALTEFVLIAAVLAIVAIPGIAFLRTSQEGFFTVQRASLSTPSLYSAPVVEADCKNGQWLVFYIQGGGRFVNQGDCQSWVSTGGTNPPGE